MPSRWFLIVRDGTCPECGLVASSVEERDLGAAIVEEGSRWDDLLVTLGGTPLLSARPAPGVWSALEYAGHVRETLALFADRVELALGSDDPHFQYQDQDAAVEEGSFNDADPREVAADLRANAARLCQLLEAMPALSWRRGGTRLEGERFDVALLARFALHEARHHRIDAQRSARR